MAYNWSAFCLEMSYPLIWNSLFLIKELRDWNLVLLRSAVAGNNSNLSWERKGLMSSWKGSILFLVKCWELMFLKILFAIVFFCCWKRWPQAWICSSTFALVPQKRVAYTQKKKKREKSLWAPRYYEKNISLRKEEHLLTTWKASHL